VVSLSSVATASFSRVVDTRVETVVQDGREDDEVQVVLTEM
jgi:hypothetical protein